MRVAVRRLEHAHDLALPSYATAGSAGLDLLAAVNTVFELPPNARAAIPCGIAIALPEGFEAQVRPRSGLALNYGITLLNAPGTIDSDYRGEIKAILINLGQEAFHVTRGMRIAQLVIARCVQAKLEETQNLPESVRNTGGFGSTGLMRDT